MVIIHIEHTTDRVHGGGSWGLGRSLWSPSFKSNGIRNGYWSSVLDVKKGDIILHIVGENNEAELIGSSIARTDGYITNNIPPKLPGKYIYSDSFNRVELESFVEFNPINIYELFTLNEKQFKTYHSENRKKSKKSLLFYQLKQTGLEFTNGGYLTPVDDTLYNIIFDKQENINKPNENDVTNSSILHVSTGQGKSLVDRRIGQNRFSKGVKLNYDNKCCFPDCNVDLRDFLIGSHIVPWSENEEKRGEISNGLSLCNIHDKAFENGYFSLDRHYKVILNEKTLGRSDWIKEFLSPYQGKTIKEGVIKPNQESLEMHRIKFSIK